MEHNMRAHLVRYQVGMNVIKISWFVLFIAVSNTGTVHNSTHAIKWIFRKLEKKTHERDKNDSSVWPDDQHKICASQMNGTNESRNRIEQFQLIAFNYFN